MKKILWGISLALLLLVFDQGVKLGINHIYSFDGNPLQETGVHLHPEMNDQDMVWAIDQTGRIGMTVPFWIAVNVVGKLFAPLFLMFTIGVLSVMKVSATGEHSFLLAKYSSIFLFASALGSVADLLFWGGSLDWCCISIPSHANENKANIMHYIFDLKDIYFVVAILLILLVILQTFIKMLRFTKDKEAEKRFWKKEFPSQFKVFIRHPIRYFQEENYETRPGSTDF